MAEPLKNHFDAACVALVADAIDSAGSKWGRTSFEAAVTAQLDQLELKDRVNLIADELFAALGRPFPDAIATVVPASGHEGIDGFTAWPLCSVVERHGVDHPTESLDAMAVLTTRFSCEFAIRPFLEHHFDETIARCQIWTHDADPTVRRLPSEGTRPYLPWGPKVAQLLDDPEVGIGLLHELRHDPDEVVRRSVANHLNDVSRDHPERVVEIATAWMAEPDIDEAMVRHALRSLIKKGHPGAMTALGFATEAEVEVASFEVAPTSIRLGDAIELAATVTSTAAATRRFVVDFVIHHVRGDGSTTSKVFKWTTAELAPGESAAITKKRTIATASIRRYFAGEHRVDLQVAGTVVASAAFTLENSSDDE